LAEELTRASAPNSPLLRLGNKLQTSRPTPENRNRNQSIIIEQSNSHTHYKDKLSMPIISIDILKEIPLFSLLDEAEMAVLANNLDEKNYLAGQIIIREGEEGSTMFVVARGKVELFLKDKTGQRVSFGMLGTGELFGELSLLDQIPRSASAIAIENTLLYVIDRHDLEILVTAHPPAALDMMAILGRRIREANALVGERVSRNVNEEVREKITFGIRLSDGLTNAAGSIKFVYVSFAWFFIWIVLNVGIIPGLKPFDPFPFGLLTMVVSLEAIFLSLFVLISQNRQTQRDKVRNDIEYEVNLKAEIEIRQLMNTIDELQQLIIKNFSEVHAAKLQNGIAAPSHPSVKAIPSVTEDAEG
jgi:CRP/FNR family cyclic AMP-dependent transcriptional regulator